MFEYSFKYIKAVDSLSLILVKSNDKLDPPKSLSQIAAVPVDDEPARKRRRTLSITESSSNILSCFSIARMSHRYLQQKMGKQYSSVGEELNAQSWRWYSLFLADIAVFNNDTDLAATQQNHCKENPIDELRILTQQALGSNGPSNTFKSLWSLLDNLPTHSETAPQSVPDIGLSNPDTNDNFSFVVNTRSKLCLHICRTLINMVQGRVSKTKQSDILALLLIIYQFDVDTFETELERTVEAVKSVKTFKYKGLLGQVTEVVLLEELLHLAVHTDVRLDISSDAKKRYNKEDVIKCIKQHVEHCKDSSEEDVIRFILDHKELIETKFSQFAFASS